MPISKLTFGTPEKFTPMHFAPAARREISDTVPECAKTIDFSVSRRGTRLTMPIDLKAGVYGFGLQLKGFQHRGTKKHLRSNADPKSNSGDSHAPVPFFVTTEGFGIYIDTARSATIYCGKQRRPDPTAAATIADKQHGFTTDLNELYAVKVDDEIGRLIIEIPVAEGVDIYFITGDSILDIVSQYNLLSGGGCLPPMWGLGCYYRCELKFNSERVIAMAKKFRDLEIPCDVLGLEPGWQTTAYSSSFVWAPDRFPDPASTVAEIKKLGFHINVWQHAYTHPSSPIFRDLIPYSGDYLVWHGLVPDFATAEGRRIFADHQRKTLVDAGVDGMKLDECDGSDFTGSWSYPDCTQFPSGLDGEQYHALMGELYAQTAMQALGLNKTMSEVRNMGALAASYPFVLYSDLYGHKDFVTGVVNAGFSGLLWTPEVRHAGNARELIRRVQSVVFSVHALINAWYLDDMPWIALGCTDEIRELFRLRMSLVPYLYAAFHAYHETGRPPLRALVCDYQDQGDSWNVDDEYLFGDSIIVAPIMVDDAGNDPGKREVWLPEGEWYDFFTGERVPAGKRTVETKGIPVYVKGGTLLPLAKPVQHVADDTRFEIELREFGDCSNAVCRLVEDGENARVIELRKGETSIDSARYAIIR